MAEFVQVGFTATRDPGTGEFLPAVPLFIEKTASAEQGQGRSPYGERGLKYLTLDV